jgi:hypothetical protein
MKNRLPELVANRREFLRNGLRHALLAGVGAVSALLIRRGGGKLSSQACINQGICRGCGAFAGCGLPQALSAKEFQPRRSRREEAQVFPNHSQGLLTSSPANEGEKT